MYVCPTRKLGPKLGGGFLSSHPPPQPPSPPPCYSLSLIKHFGLYPAGSSCLNQQSPGWQDVHSHRESCQPIQYPAGSCDIRYESLTVNTCKCDASCSEGLHAWQETAASCGNLVETCTYSLTAAVYLASEAHSGYLTQLAMQPHNTCKVTSMQEPVYCPSCPQTPHQTNFPVHIQVKICAESANVGKFCGQLVCIDTFDSNHLVGSLILPLPPVTAAKWSCGLPHCLARSSDCRSDQLSGHPKPLWGSNL